MGVLDCFAIQGGSRRCYGCPRLFLGIAKLPLNARPFVGVMGVLDCFGIAKLLLNARPFVGVMGVLDCCLISTFQTYFENDASGGFVL